MGQLDRFLSVALAFSTVAEIGSLVCGIAKPKTRERFTEFYLLEPDGAAAGYPREIVVNRPITLTIGVVKHEYSDVQYCVERREDVAVEHIASPYLGHEEIWDQPYAFTLAEPGENRKVAFLLYKGDDEEPYRSLHLWITVKEKSSAQ
jgi:uncharacterized membrane protein